MREKNQAEIADRRRLFRLFDKGKPVAQILKLIPRSRAWIYKWKQRFAQQGFAALGRADTAPHSSPQAYPRETVALVLRVRRRFERAGVGLVGAHAIRRELKQQHRLKRLPSLASINRWLQAAGLLSPVVEVPQTSYYPAPQPEGGLVFHACDWIQRYLTGGEKVFAFHTVDWETHALWQSVGQDKTTQTVLRQALEVWQALGLPDFLQLDNDAAFTGLGKLPRVFGSFVRLALDLGIESIFIPPGAAKRNWLVEGINHLWARSFWDKHDFTSFGDFARKRQQFLAWYANYEPPAEGGLSVAQASAGVARRRLKRREVAQLPEPLPLVAGRIHFIRRVSAAGEIELLKERWKVSLSVAHQYVWATLTTHRQRLEIYHRRSPRAKARLVKCYDYELTERVWPLEKCYRRRRRALDVLKLI
jgi:transposase